MGSFSDYLENTLLDEVFGGTNYAPAATHYFALFTAAPSDSGGGTEVAGGSYTRKSVTNNTTNYPNASGGTKSNGTAVTFVTSTGSWGTITHFAIFDASTSGNMLAWGALAASKTVGSGDTFNIAIGDLTITLD